ncbi:AraC family transcriptional regulator [Ramlibacter sp. WS9]|uniref:AraC family transcriptional regulator n=1 Tax=Ramlibacter sp. WS9 TaxID=1882741 RepID=UPI001E40779A|nr:AraC family transcriptional regulator [Ramlibacter sp. WS9]
MQHGSHPNDWARFQPGAVEGVTLMKAHFQQHAFERHSHETYSIGLTHAGVQTFNCCGTLHASLPGDLILFNPDQAHDGKRGAPEGFGYSMLYVPEDVVAGCADPEAGIVMPRHFRQPVVRGGALARQFAQAVAAINQPGETLRAEELTRHVLAAILVRHGETGTRHLDPRAAGGLRMNKVRDHLQAHYAQDVDVLTLAGIAGLSRAHLTRAFAQHFGVPPHIYLNAVRVRKAQEAMLAGTSLADVAVDCGFADQSHFSRRFKGALGVTPAQWLRQMRVAGTTLRN